MPTATDVLRAKTDAELQFFVDNPGYYQPELVAAARQELRRRGVAPAPDQSAPLALPEYEAEDTGRARWPLLAAAAAGLLGLGGTLYWTAQPAAPAPRPALTSLKLETVESHVLPNFDIDKLTAEQLARVPAAEQREPQVKRQFQGLCRRFWAAETQSEYLTAQAHAGKASPVFADQTLVARETWRSWNKAVVYGYRFGPVMQKQFERMGQVASSQQHILARLPSQLPGRKFLTDKELQARDADVQAWLADLRPVSPVTGQRYRTTVMTIKL